jgi:hypothetical protein
VSTVKTFPRKKTDYPAPIQAVDKAPADRPKAEKVPGKLKLNGAWEVQLTEAQRRQYDYPTISMFRAKAFVFTDDVPEIRAAAKGVPYLQSFRVILDESVKPVRLTLVAERAGVRVHFRTQYMLNVWPCAVERINEDNIRIAFKRSGFLSKKLGTYNSRGPARPPMPRRGGGGFKPSKGVVPAARVEKALNGVTVNYPEKITWFGDLKGDLVVIPLRRAKPKVEDKKTEDKKAEKPPVKDSEHVVQCVVESATLEHRKCLCRVRGCKRVIPYYKIVLTDKAAKKTYTVNTSWNFNLEKGELVDFNPKTTKIHKEGKQHPYYTKQGRRAQR